MSIEFYGDYISKCHMIMNKRTPFPGSRLLPSQSKKLKLKDNHYGTPCSMCSLALGTRPNKKPKLNLTDSTKDKKECRLYIHHTIIR